MNVVNYLLDDSGFMQLRSREIKLRMLDNKKIAESKGFWKILNILVPVGIILIFGFIWNFARNRKYSKKF
jgi:ABC-2 type transport system permease protein